LQLEPDEFLRGDAIGRVDVQVVDALIAARLLARSNKDWTASDQIRDQLSALGVILEDSKGVTSWRLAD
jgi:cysteinyl-tRNA synthetase